ncbi:hypothetical protein SAMN02745248_00523 [Hathewaya proteolytica DSM 3090]|uniref:DUF2383 domain-containing protein n=1 Tax=Hathewaya proteolytica DSM 3090 TaxID=1121331 RepID=A0A1M6KMJ4_9CLOT|nr:hypothetical protein [Hathewaya proteolytica]SHJ60074.1 hypothetical protein SAMN02745248_00523 [Hathewaya proteolytica DSM 3090]
MSSENELLNYILQNAEMGKDTINQLLSITEDEKFRQELRNQLAEYIGIYEEARKMISEKGGQIKEINKIAKISTDMSINIKTIMDKSVSHIAEMMINGSVMGIINIIKKLKEYHIKNDEISKLGNDLLKIEEDNFNRLKEFL